METTQGRFSPRIRNFWKVILIMIGFFFVSKICFAHTFNIIPERDLPTTVPKFGKTSAFFVIKNTTNVALNDNFVKSLPHNIKQVTCNPDYCGAKFNLAASGSATDSCILKLTIKGHVNSASLRVCTAGETSCDSSQAITVSEGIPDSFIGIGVGGYDTQNHSDLFPLLAVTNDTGLSWSYHSTIFQDLTTIIDPTFAGALFLGASCTGSSNKNLCIASGHWCKGGFCGLPQPLIAVGKKNGTQWTYPKSVFDNLQTRIDPGLQWADLREGSCFGSGGSAVCVVPGFYQNSVTTFPLIALTSNGGEDWSYPSTLYQNLTTSIDPNFTSGSVTTAACTKNTCDSVCIAAGSFCTNAECNSPLLALSRDKGQTWRFPHAIFEDLKTKIDPSFLSALFDATACTGIGNQAICIATGNYWNGQHTTPVLALTQNGGSNWTYPTYIFKDLNTTIRPDFQSGEFLSASCTGAGKKAVCIAAGDFATSTVVRPLIAVSRDGGNNWNYPKFIHTKLKTLVDPNARNSAFLGSSCTGGGSKSICVAAGYYCLGKHCPISIPLLATSKDGGKTWSYPPSVFKNLTSSIDPTFQSGVFQDVHCSGAADHNFCIATGRFHDGNGDLPLVAISTNGAQTWIYQKPIFKNIGIKIPGFDSGGFTKAGSSGNGLKPKFGVFKNTGEIFSLVELTR